MKNKIINILLERSFPIPNNDAEISHDMVVSMFDFGDIAEQIIKLFTVNNNNKVNDKRDGLEVCAKCGVSFMPSLIMPYTICHSCQELLAGQIEIMNYAKKWWLENRTSDRKKRNVEGKHLG